MAPIRRAKAKAASRYGRADEATGHMIQAVFDPGEDEGFVYTYGASPEFLIDDVPRERTEDVANLMNFLVDRVRSGHPVITGHTVQSQGLMFVAAKLRDLELREALANKCVMCRSDADVVLLQPVIVADSRASWAQAPPDDFLALARRAGAEMFPRVPVSADDHARMSLENASGGECAVCFEARNLHSPPANYDCPHALCASCWGEMRYNCPVCRRPLVPWLDRFTGR